MVKADDVFYACHCKTLPKQITTNEKTQINQLNCAHKDLLADLVICYIN